MAWLRPVGECSDAGTGRLTDDDTVIYHTTAYKQAAPFGRGRQRPHCRRRVRPRSGARGQTGRAVFVVSFAPGGVRAVASRRPVRVGDRCRRGFGLATGLYDGGRTGPPDDTRRDRRPVHLATLRFRTPPVASVRSRGIQRAISPSRYGSELPCPAALGATRPSLVDTVGYTGVWKIFTPV